jgi:hypothetical protein
MKEQKPAFRSAVSVLLRALGDFSLHPQGRPAGGRLRRPSSAGSTTAEYPQTARTVQLSACPAQHALRPALGLSFTGLTTLAAQQRPADPYLECTVPGPVP